MYKILESHTSCLALVLLDNQIINICKNVFEKSGDMLQAITWPTDFPTFLKSFKLAKSRRTRTLHHHPKRARTSVWVSTLQLWLNCFNFHVLSKFKNRKFPKVSSKLVLVLSVLQFCKALFYFSWNPKVWCLIAFGDSLKKLAK